MTITCFLHANSYLQEEYFPTYYLEWHEILQWCVKMGYIASPRVEMLEIANIPESYGRLSCELNINNRPMVIAADTNEIDTHLPKKASEIHVSIVFEITPRSCVENG